MTKHLAIVGGGPKAAAIATKAVALLHVGFTAPIVTIFEKSDIGAAWSGRAGYTDGVARLCTRPERDLGYPYDATAFGKTVTEAMIGVFSWAQYLVATQGYSSWINRGLRKPAHADYAGYLRWAIGRSSTRVVRKEVDAIGFDPVSKTWTLGCIDGTIHPLYDGVVVTGSGVPRPAMTGAGPEVYDGRDLATKATQIAPRLMPAEDPPVVVVIGSGGTAGAAAAWFVRNGYHDIPIHIIGKEPALWTRTASFFEDKVFGDDEYWSQLGPADQSVLFKRLNSGFLWEEASDVLSRSGNVDYVPARALRFERHGIDLVLVADVNGSERLFPASVFVDCRGFDGRWFEQFLPKAPGDPILADPLVFDDAMALTASVYPHPGLHVPGLAVSAGPAAGNLMALGWMADRIIRDYLPVDELLRGPAGGSTGVP